VIESILNDIKLALRSNANQIRIASKSDSFLLMLPFLIEKEFDSHNIEFLKNGKERYIKIESLEIYFFKYNSDSIKKMIQKSYKNIVFYD
jgi:hypothetical protein